MDYVAVGCFSIDNIINTRGVKKLNVFGGNAAFGAAGIYLWHEGNVGSVSERELISQANGSDAVKTGKLIQ